MNGSAAHKPHFDPGKRSRVSKMYQKGQMTCSLEKQFCLFANKKPVRKKLTHMKGAFAKKYIKSRRFAAAAREKFAFSGV